MSVMKQTGMPNLPSEAVSEIMEHLADNLSISSEEIAKILKRHKVSADPEALQCSYRKRLGQRLIASIRDDDGKRELLSAGRTYVILDCCNDAATLKKINKKLDKEVAGINRSKGKVKQRMKVLNRFTMEKLEELA